MMAQNKIGKPRIASGGRSGGLPSHVMSIELKHRILSALSKLADRDTHQIATEELERVVHSLSSEGISMCLSCLYDIDSKQKTIVRKECVKLFGAIATIHGDAIAPHLTKIISNIVKRIRDPDSKVRDACQETMGILAAQYLSTNLTVGDNGGQSKLGSVVGLFVKPLFEAMIEQNKSVQTGATACLRKVIECAKDPPIAAFQRFCPRICKYLSNHTFLAKAALLSVIGSLAQIGAISQQNLTLLMPCIHESLDSNDWATRKTAADTLSQMATHLSHSLEACKPSTVLILEACRFDKVKPVRQSVAEALELWKNISASEADLSYITLKLPTSDVLDNENAEMTQSLKHFDLKSRSIVGNKVGFIDKDGTNNSYPVSNCLASVEDAKSQIDNPVSILKKEISGLTDKKLNLEFFQKIETRGSDEWKIEVQTLHEEEFEGNNMSFQDRSSNMKMAPRGPNGAQKSLSAAIREVDSLDMYISQRAGDTYDRNEIAGKFLQDQFMEDGGLWNGKPKVTMAETDEWHDHNKRDKPLAIQSWDAKGTRSSTVSSDSFDDDQATNGKDYWSVIQRQLSQLEQQQASLMEMLQELMGRSQDGMLSLEKRVQGLEGMVEDMSRDLVILAGKQNNSHMLGFEDSNERSSGKYYTAPDNSSPNYATSNDGVSHFSERFSSFNVIQSRQKGGREWLSNADTDIWDGQACAMVRNDHLAHRKTTSRMSMSDCLNEIRSTKQDTFDGKQLSNTRSWDMGAGPIRLGEGPSARSVWKASKNEATLAAIRVAGEDARASEVEALPESLPSITSSRVNNLDSNAEGPQYKSLVEKGPFWKLWSHTIEHLHSGDTDQAYVEVLCTGDELLLVRLMSHTGPVLDHLSVGTVNDVLYAIGQLLQQQNFFGFAIPWIQQVSNIVSESGPDCLELSLEAKKHLLLCLQEASSMDLPEGWDGNVVDELFHHLLNAWSTNMYQKVSGN